MKAFGVLLGISLSVVGFSRQVSFGLRGIVVSSADQSPVGNAIVELRTQESAEVLLSTKTATDGSFHLPAITDGKYQVTVVRDGYVPLVFGQRYLGGPGEVLTVAAGQTVPPLRLALIRDGVISGRVVDSSGRPLADVRVSAGKLTYAGGQRSIEEVQNRITNDLGEYRLFSLPPGQYYVTARPPESAGLAPITYPNSITPVEGVPVDLRVGALIQGIDVRLGSPAMERRIRAVAVDLKTGRPIAATSWNFLGARINTVSAAAVFEMERAVPGRYTLVGGADEQFGRLTFEVVDKDLELLVPLGETFDIEGRLSIERGSQGAALAGIRITLDADSVLRGPTTSSTTVVRADGSFTFTDLMPGRFRVSAAMPALPNAYVKAIRRGLDDGLMDWLTIDRPSGGPLEILLSTNAATVEGRVAPTEQNQPVNGVTVVLVPERERRPYRQFFRSVLSGKDGAFLFERVPPGDYKVFAWEHVAKDSWLAPEFLKTEESQGFGLELLEGSHRYVEVPILPAR